MQHWCKSILYQATYPCGCPLIVCWVHFFGWFWSEKYHMHILTSTFSAFAARANARQQRFFSVACWCIFVHCRPANAKIARSVYIWYSAVFTIALAMWKCTMLIHHDNNSAWNQNNYTNILLRYRMRIHTQELPQNLCAWVYDHAWVLATWYWQIGTTIQMVINTCNEFFGADSNLHKHHNHYSHINNALPLIL